MTAETHAERVTQESVMKVYHKAFEEAREQMEAWCARQECEDWPSPDVKHWAAFVKLSLWTLSHNKDNPPVLVSALEQYMVNLERAKSAHTSHVG